MMFVLFHSATQPLSENHAHRTQRPRGCLDRSDACGCVDELSPNGENLDSLGGDRMDESLKAPLNATLQMSVQGHSKWPSNCVRSDGAYAEDSSHKRPNGCVHDQRST
jgi:hypothetical protein